MKKLLSILLSLSLLATFVPGPVLAAGRSRIDAEELPAEAPKPPQENAAAELPAEPIKVPVELSEEARTVVGSGACGADGDDLTWTFYSDGALYISGSGAMMDYVGNVPEYTGYRSQITSVALETGVTHIGQGAFYGCSKLAGVAIPESVTSIGEGAFYGCSKLTHVTIPESVVSIGYRAFALCFCSELTDIMIPEGVTSIGEEAFLGCSALTSVSIPASVTSIGVWAFGGCSSLADFEVAEENLHYTSLDGVLLSKDHKALMQCPEKKAGEYRVPADVTSIEKGAFYGCSALTSVIIPESVASIGSNAFSGCSALTKVSITDLAAWCGISFSYDSNPLAYAHNLYLNGEPVSALTIPDGVTSIGSYAFSGCSTLVGVTIPEGVTHIGSSAFRGCSALTDITIPESVTNIGDSAFNGCSHLKYVTLGKAAEVGAYAFYDCSSPLGVFFLGTEEDRQGMSIGSNNTLLENARWHYITSPDEILTVTLEQAEHGELMLRDTLYAAGERILVVSKPDAGYRLQTVLVDGQPIEGRAFTASGNHVVTGEFQPYKADQIVTSGTCGRDLTWTLYRDGELYISGAGEMKDYWYGSYAPWHTNYRDQITSVVLETGVTTVGDYAFDGCSALTGVTIPEGVTSIGAVAFSGCSSLTGVTIPEGVTGILLSAFSGCSALTGVTIPQSVTHIGKNAFFGCSKLTGISIPSNVRVIGSGSFADCSALADIEVAEDNLYYTSLDGVLFRKDPAVLIAYPAGKQGGYAIPDHVTSVEASAFYGCSGLTGVTVPERVTSIGENAFYGCSALPSITVPEGVTNIQRGTFRYCSSLTAVALPRSLTSIEGGGLSSPNGAFYGCSSLADITIPKGVTSIGNYAFARCSSLTSVTIPEGVTSIEGYTFDHCSSLTDVTIPEGVTSIGEDAFSDCSSLTGVTIPEGVTGIEHHAFAGCDKLASVIIPESVTSIGRYAFNDCFSLTGVTIPKGVTSIGENAFYGCTSLKGFSVDAENPAYSSDQWGVLYNKDRSTLISYPAARQWPHYNVSDRTTTISQGAFYQCKNLVDLYIPRTVTTLENLCISSSRGLTVCVYRNSPADIYAGNHSLTAWYMDNYVLQDIEIYSPPEQQAFRMGEEDFTGLYVVANGGKALQVDEYTLAYDPNRTGLQTVTVSYRGKSASFPILLYGATEQLLDFDRLTLADSTLAYAAIYDANGKMTRLEQATLLGGKAQLVVPSSVYDSMSAAKLFVVREGGFVPVQAARVIAKQS